MYVFTYVCIRSLMPLPFIPMISAFQAPCALFLLSRVKLCILGLALVTFSPRSALCANQAACRNKCLTSVCQTAAANICGYLLLLLLLIWFELYVCMYVLMYACESARQVFRYWFRSRELTSFDHNQTKRTKIQLKSKKSIYNQFFCIAANHKDYPNNKRSRENLACDEQQLTATSTTAAMNVGSNGGRTPPLMRSCSSPAVYGK